MVGKVLHSDLAAWLNGEGANFLTKVGLKTGDMVLDFGCGSGHYSIPAAQVVGSSGMVHALDKEEEVLNQLRKQANENGLLNIEIDKTSGELKIYLPDESIDVILAYDMLHYLERREKLFDEFHRVLKNKGFLSIYPKHHQDDFPLSNLAHLSLEEVIEEIEESNFSLREKFFTRLIHDNNYNQGYILNFSA